MICPRCQRLGDHPTDEACLAAIRSAMRAKINLPPVAWTPDAVKVPHKRKADRAGYNPDLLTIGQACAITQMTRTTIYNWIRSGKIERVYTAGNQVRIVAASLWRTAQKTEIAS